MELVYKLGEFEGPMELLLHLIEKEKVDIYDISIVKLTDQYLEYIDKVKDYDLEYMSDFIIMAVTLIDIKTKFLLPKQIDESTGDELDPASGLIKRLVEYKMFKCLSNKLASMQDEEKANIFKSKTIPKEIVEYEEPVNLDEVLLGVDVVLLKNIFDNLIKESEDKIDKERVNFGKIPKEKISLSNKIVVFLSDIRKLKNVSMKTYLGKKPEKIEIIVTFLAILELMKAGKINASVDEDTKDIFIESIDGSDDDLHLDLMED